MYVVVMTIDGAAVPSSAVKVAGKRECDACAARLNRQAGKHLSVKWIVLETKT